MIDVSYVIVTYNSAKLVGKLLDSILASRDKLIREVILVDNASADDSASVASRHKLKPKVVRNPTNIGFSRAVNKALRMAKGEYVFILNPDTKLVGQATKHLYDFAARNPVLGAVVPKLVDPNGRSQPSAFHFPTITNALRRYLLNQSERYGKYLPILKTTQLDIAVMAAFFVPHAVFGQVGFLDERYFLYYEDIEFCRRLARAGLPIYYLPEAKVMHVHGASGSFKSHAESPLLKSAMIYHGPLYFKVLNLVLWLGQKYEKLLNRLHLR